MKYWEKKELVRSLRHQGLSYKEIRQRIPFTIAKSTISNWCKDIELTDKQKQRLGAKYDILHRGAKANQITAFSNSDPKLVKFMVEWFERICNVPRYKMKAHLNIHSGQDETQIKQFWSKITGIPEYH